MPQDHLTAGLRERHCLSQPAAHMQLCCWPTSGTYAGVGVRPGAKPTLPPAATTPEPRTPNLGQFRAVSPSLAVVD